MSKTFTLEYWMGAQTELRYTTKERDELEDRFGMGLLELLQQKILPTKVEDGKTVYTGGGQWKAQVAVVYMGLRHAGPKIKESAVSEWMSKQAQQQGGECFKTILTAGNAVLYSGVLGFVPPEEDEEGKGVSVPAA